MVRIRDLETGRDQDRETEHGEGKDPCEDEGGRERERASSREIH